MVQTKKKGHTLQNINNKHFLTGVPTIFIILPPSPCKHRRAAILCTEIGQPIRVTVHSHKVKSFEHFLQRHVGEGWVAMNNEKNSNFSVIHGQHMLLISLYNENILEHYGEETVDNLENI